MGQGLQVWDAAGQMIFDTPDRMGRIVGVVGTTGFTYTAPAGCTPFWFTARPPSLSGAIPNIVVSGQSMTLPASDGKSIFYGYY